MKILVTGATGLLGSNLVARLYKEGHVVLRMSKTLGHDLLNREKTAFTIKCFGPEIVFHLAANAAESRGQVSPIDMTDNNLGIFLNVLVPSIRAKQFIFTSSVAVYGEAEVPYSEDDIPKPKDVYGVNKLAAEQILKILSKVHGLNYTIFRPHNIYGPHQDMSNPYKNVVALFMRNLIEDKECTIFGEGKMKRAFSYVDDVVDVFIDSINNPKYMGQVLNVGSCFDIDLAYLLMLIESVSGKKAKIKHLPARPQEIYLFLASHRKQSLMTTYNETPLLVGLKKTWDYVSLPEIKQFANEIK